MNWKRKQKANHMHSKVVFGLLWFNFSYNFLNWWLQNFPAVWNVETKCLLFCISILLIYFLFLMYLCYILLIKVPEMLRMPLVELCLQIKLLSLGYIKPFLSEVNNYFLGMKKYSLIRLSKQFLSISFHYQALEPPKIEAMNSAISLLYEVLYDLFDYVADLNVWIILDFDFLPI